MDEAAADHRSGPRRRDAVGTRRRLLDTARELIIVQGTQVSLDTIARTAQISKGGLLHYFGGKVDLFLALMRDVYETFAREVDQRSRRSGTDRPGCLVRAYLNVTFDNLRHLGNPSAYATVVFQLCTIPPVADYARSQLRGWDDALYSDGISADVVRLVTLTADGLAISALLGRIPSPEELDRLEQQLLGLVDGGETQLTAAERPERDREQSRGRQR